MRKKVRGLRAIERKLLPLQPTPESPAIAEGIPDSSAANVPPEAAAPLPSANAVVLDYCTAVKGILNDDQGGPLHPPGLRMAAALTSVRQSVARNLEAKKGGLQNAP